MDPAGSRAFRSDHAAIPGRKTDAIRRCFHDLQSLDGFLTLVKISGQRVGHPCGGGSHGDFG